MNSVRLYNIKHPAVGKIVLVKDIPFVIPPIGEYTEKTFNDEKVYKSVLLSLDQMLANSWGALSLKQPDESVVQKENNIVTTLQLELQERDQRLKELEEKLAALEATEKPVKKATTNKKEIIEDVTDQN